VLRTPAGSSSNIFWHGESAKVGVVEMYYQMEGSPI